MRSALTASAACLVAWLCFFVPPAHARPDRPSPEKLASKVEEYLTARAEHSRFSGTILLARNGQILFCRGYGMANLEHDVPCTHNTKFRLGSITKQFTAMAILILQERGKLAVSDKVKKYVPAAGKAWDEITIHHLLTHTSGIPNYLLKWDRALDSEKLLHKKSVDAMFTPAKSNYGYGWTIDKKFDLARHVHGGGIPGFITMIERFPQEKLLIVVLSNFEGTRIGTIADDLAAITLGGPYVVPHEPTPAKVESAVLAAYAGRYELDRGDGKEKLPITVTAAGNQLQFEVKGQGRLVAIPETVTQFYLKGADATVEFTRGSKGEITRLMLLQNNQYLNAVKTQPVSAPAAGQPRNEPAAKAVPQPVPGASSSPREPSREPGRLLTAAARVACARSPRSFWHRPGVASEHSHWRTFWGRTNLGATMVRPVGRSEPTPSGMAAFITVLARRESCSFSCPARPVSVTPSITSRSSCSRTAGNLIPAARSSCSRASRARSWPAHGSGASSASAASGSATLCLIWPAVSTTSRSCRRWSRSQTCTAPRRSCRTRASFFRGFRASGAWVSYGLGNLSQNLPSFVVLPDSRGSPPTARPTGPPDSCQPRIRGQWSALVRRAPSLTCFRPMITRCPQKRRATASRSFIA